MFLIKDLISILIMDQLKEYIEEATNDILDKMKKKRVSKKKIYTEICKILKKKTKPSKKTKKKKIARPPFYVSDSSE